MSYTVPPAALELPHLPLAKTQGEAVRRVYSRLGGANSFGLCLVAVAIFGAVLRFSALTGSGGLLRFPIDYDEGVYATAGIMVSRGSVPYRDFVFVHPPGLAYLLTPLGWLGPYRALAAGRILMAMFGLTSIVLIGLLARRAWGRYAGIAAAMSYASFPEAVWAEHGVFIEPALNLASLTALTCWLRTHEEPSGRRALWQWPLAAGILVGVCVSLKLTGLVMVAVLLTAPPTTARLQKLGGLLLGLLPALIVLLVTVFVAGLGPVWNQILGFQVSRPPDGVVSRAERLKLLLFDWSSLDASVLGSRHVFVSLLVLIGLAKLAISRRRLAPLERMALAWLGLLTFTFLMSATYWDQYNAALGAVDAGVLPTLGSRDRECCPAFASAQAFTDLAV